ncbi:MAG: phosphotransferase [Candidatus Doudnabacteria bacterium]|nr:phosphotransferase [Candidatus Doudnabacteria bacterium]
MSILITRIQKYTPIARLIEHLRDPLYRNGYALVFSSGATSALGMVYWMVAARTYTVEVVGLNSAVISAMTFLTHLAVFNMMNALNRFLPNMSSAVARRMIAYAYLISSIAALVFSLVFLLGISAWEPELDFLSSSPSTILWFTGATMIWCIFVLQDSALTGLRQAIWVPADNLLFALAKIGLLVALVSILPFYGVFASWTIACAITILPTNFLIFGRLLPRHVAATGDRAELIPLNQVIKYVAGDYFGSLVSNAVIGLLPVIIISQVSSSANAYYYLCWTITYALYLVSRNMGISFIAEVAGDQSKLNLTSFRLFKNTATIMVPLIAIIALGAPYILRLFGGDYANEGATLLRLLCLSALPNIVVSIYTSIVRVQRRIPALVLILTIPYLLVIAFSFIFMDTYGINGVGMAWLVGQSLTAGVLLATELRTMWTIKDMQKETSIKLLLKAFVDGFRKLRSGWSSKQIISRYSPWISEIVRPASLLTEIASSEKWEIKQVLSTLRDMDILVIGTQNSSDTAMLHLPKSESALFDFERNIKALAALHADARLGDWRRLLPRLLFKGQFQGWPYFIVERLSGISAEKAILDNTDTSQAMLDSIFDVIGDFHQKTAREVIVGDQLLKDWVFNPIQNFRNSNLVYFHRKSHVILDRLERQMSEKLRNQRQVVSCIHGDCWPGNYLVIPDGSRVIGVIDWDYSQPTGLPIIDLVGLFLSLRRMKENRELGEIITDVLKLNAWSEHEQALWEQAEHKLNIIFPGIRESLVIFWLHHLNANVQKNRYFSLNPIWVYGNFVKVLNQL